MVECLPRKGEARNLISSTKENKVGKFYLGSQFWRFRAWSVGLLLWDIMVGAHDQGSPHFLMAGSGGKKERKKRDQDPSIPFRIMSPDGCGGKHL